MEEFKNQGEEEDVKIKGRYYDRQPQLGKNGPSKIRRQFARGIGTFLIIAASIVFYFVFLRFSNIFTGFGTVINILKPIIYGLFIAYLLHPIVQKVEKLVMPFMEHRFDRKETSFKLARGCGIAVAFIFAIMVIVLLCNMVIPELYKSIRSMIYTVPYQMSQWVKGITDVTSGESTLSVILNNALQQGTDYFQTWMQTDLLKQTNILMTNLTEGVVNILSEVFYILIGFIIAVYVLTSKELFLGQCKKVLYAVLTPHRANVTLHIARKSNEIFGGFIIGKLLDSLIIGILCFICLSILNMPYVLLVSVIVGVTNVIPFFGPYIGAIPSAILILLQSPIQGVYFIIFILILQQVDGNIIGPKILGDSTGLSAFWVVFAILLGGGLFGFVGMLLGVPTFAVIYYIVGMIIDQKLAAKNLPTQSLKYDERSYVDDVTGAFVPSTKDSEASAEDGSRRRRTDDWKEKTGDFFEDITGDIQEKTEEIKKKIKGE